MCNGLMAAQELMKLKENLALRRFMCMGKLFHSTDENWALEGFCWKLQLMSSLVIMLLMVDSCWHVLILGSFIWQGDWQWFLVPWGSFGGTKWQQTVEYAPIMEYACSCAGKKR